MEGRRHVSLRARSMPRETKGGSFRMKRPLLVALAALLIVGGLRDDPAAAENRSPYFRLVEQDSVERYGQFERLFRRFIGCIP